MTLQRKTKPSTCKICGGEYTRLGMRHTACSPACAIALVDLKKRQQEEQALRRDTRERKAKLKTLSDYRDEAKVAVNRYVRIRDAGKPCVSCDKPDNGQHQRHASHYRSVAACSALRFNLKNIHASCQQCNTSKSGNVVEYRIRLVKRIGRDAVRWIEEQNQPVRYSREYLIRLKKVFNRRADRLLQRREQRIAA